MNGAAHTSTGPRAELEPLEKPLPARGANAATDLNATQEIKRIVLEQTGAEPQALTLLRTKIGRVIFLTLNVPADTSLVDAHQRVRAPAGLLLDCPTMIALSLLAISPRSRCDVPNVCNHAIRRRRRIATRGS